MASCRLYMIGRIIGAAFQFRFLALAIHVIDRRDPSNEMRCQLQPKKTKVRQHKMFYQPFITKRFSLKSGCVVCVVNGEMRR